MEACRKKHAEGEAAGEGPRELTKSGSVETWGGTTARNFRAVATEEKKQTGRGKRSEGVKIPY